MKADLHIHSTYSKHSTASLDQIIRRCRSERIDCVAITDHRTIEGGKELKNIAPFEVIVGHEVMTKEGEITGLFLEETLQPGLSLEESVAAIKAQGGLVYVPHPFERIRFKRTLSISALLRAIDEVDIIETFNSRCTLRRYNDAAEEFAIRYRRAKGAGSDAHTPEEIGRAFVIMPPFAGKEGFLRSLEQGDIHGQLSPRTVHASTMLFKLRRWLSDRFDHLGTSL